MKLSPASGPKEGAKLHDAAQALEAMMLKQIISSSGAFHGSSVAGSSIRADLFSDALAQAVARAGGIGLAAELERTLGARGAAPSPAPGPARSPAAASGTLPSSPTLARSPAAPATALPVGATPAGAAALLQTAAAAAALPPAEDGDEDGPDPVTPMTGGADPVLSTPPAPLDAGQLATAPPLVGPTRVTSAYGLRADPFSGAVRPHRGVDLAAAEGSTVSAAVPGTVKRAGPRQGYGNTVEIESADGLTTLYAHASAVLVRPGDRVEAGQPIARVGHTGRATGPHLHFEARRDGRAIDPSRLLKVYGKRDD